MLGKCIAPAMALQTKAVSLHGGRRMVVSGNSRVRKGTVAHVKGDGTVHDRLLLHS
jgi:hypothetical protein